MRLFTNRAALVLAGTVAVTSLTVGGLASASSDETTAARPTTGTAAAPTYSVFDKPDAPATDARRGPPLLPSQAIDNAQTRLAVVTSDVSVRLTRGYNKGAEVLCVTSDLGDGTGATGCASDAMPTPAGFLNAQITKVGGGYIVAGAIPDGSSDLKITLSDGTVITPPIVRNGFAASTRTAPASISHTDRNGRPSTYTPMVP